MKPILTKINLIEYLLLFPITAYFIVKIEFSATKLKWLILTKFSWNQTLQYSVFVNLKRTIGCVEFYELLYKINILKRTLHTKNLKSTSVPISEKQVVWKKKLPIQSATNGHSSHLTGIVTGYNWIIDSHTWRK